MTAAQKRVRRIILLAITVLYLLFELSFSARLLDAAGGNADMAMLHKLEHWGRTLSGLALALLGWGTLFTTRFMASWRRALFGLVIALTACIPFMFSTQSWLAENRIERMTDDERRAAVFLALATGSVRDGEMKIEGLDLSGSALSSASGKAFIALLPILTSTLPDVEDQGRGALRQALRLRQTNCRVGPDCLGTFETFFNTAWRTALKEIGDAYARYSDEDALFVTATGPALAHDQAKAWNDYVDDLAHQGWNPGTVPARLRAQVRDKLRAAGIRLAANWPLDDRASFFAAVAEKDGEDANSRYAQASQRIAGAILPHGLSVAAFFAQPAIQQRLLADLKLGGLITRLDYAIDPQTVRSDVYDKAVAAIVQREEQRFLAPSESYGDGKPLGRVGRDAAERLWVPPLALLFSLVGGLGHLCKMLVLILLLMQVPMTTALACAAALYLGLAIAFTQTNGIITRTEIYQHIERQVAQRRGPGIAAGLHWIIQAESHAWPLNNWLRRHILFGQKFGYPG